MTINKFFGALFAAGSLILLSPGQSQAAEPHPPGTLLLDAGAVYRMSEDGLSLQNFDSEEKFLSNFYDFADVVPMNDLDRAKPVTGSVPWGDGRLFMDQGTVYQVSGGLKRGFATAEVFHGDGFQFSDAVKGTLTIPAGPAVEAASVGHLPGSLVNDNGTIWLLNQTGRLGVPAPEVLLSWGRKFTDIVPAQPADLNRPVEGLLSIRNGTLINDAGTVWAIRGKNKFSFTSAECLTGFGFKFSRVIAGSTAEYTNIGTVCESGPSSNHEEVTVQTSRGSFAADVMTFNLAKGEVKMVTDTANTEDCANNCPLKTLAQFVEENDGFAGVNGTYFCPDVYADCAGKSNSFYWKVYNSRLGKMINANNGIKGEMPFLAVNDTQVQYHPLYSSWVQTNSAITAGINSEPRLIENGAIVLNELALDPAEKSKTSRVGLGVREHVVYVVAVSAASVSDLAAVMDGLGVEFAMNLDGGGSTALMYDNEYVAGPGRNIPNAIIFKK